MSKYIFPLNYKYGEKLLGIIEYKILIPLSIYAIFLILILYLAALSFFTSTSIFIILFLPIFLLTITNINGETVFSFLMSMYRFNKFSKVYLYKKDCKFDEKTVSFVHGVRRNDI